VTEIVCYVYIFHLTWPVSLHYLVKRGCSKFLPNYKTLDLIQSDCSDLVSKWRGHTVATTFLLRGHLEATARHAHCSRTSFFCVSTGRCPSASRTQCCRFPVASKRREMRRRLSAYVRERGAHFEHEFWQFWADLSWRLITLLNNHISVYCVLIQSSDSLFQIIHFNVM